MKIEINKVVLFVAVGFAIIWLIFLHTISNHNHNLNLFMDKYILVSLFYFILSIIVINLLHYIRDNFV